MHGDGSRRGEASSPPSDHSMFQHSQSMNHSPRGQARGRLSSRGRGGLPHSLDNSSPLSPPLDRRQQVPASPREYAISPTRSARGRSYQNTLTMQPPFSSSRNVGSVFCTAPYPKILMTIISDYSNQSTLSQSLTPSSLGALRLSHRHL